MDTDTLAKIIWDYNTFTEPLKKADAIWVLCSNDIRVAERGADLFLKGYAPWLIFSGGVGELTEGMYNTSEAEYFSTIAMKMGVPKEKIIIESSSTNTGENVEFTKQILGEKNLHLHNFIVVQKPYMQKRAYATIKKVWPECSITITAPEISYEDYANEIITKDHIINTMVGDLQRIKLYPEKGFQIPLELPDSVWNAYLELVKRGYTKHLLNG